MLKNQHKREKIFLIFPYQLNNLKGGYYGEAQTNFTQKSLALKQLFAYTKEAILCNPPIEHSEQSAWESQIAIGPE